MPRLAEGGFDIDSFTDSSFDGSITVPEDRTLFLLTIPRDEGWHIYVDGVETETVEVLECLTGLELEPGEHTIKMVYFPDCVKYGLIISGCSLGLFILIIIGELILRRKFPLIIFSSSGIPAESDDADTDDADTGSTASGSTKSDGAPPLITITELTADEETKAADTSKSAPDSDGNSDDETKQG